MTNRIFLAADRIADLLVGMDMLSGAPSCSTNRYGEHSAYIDTRYGMRLRVSDHSCNSNFRVDEINVSADIDLEGLTCLFAQIDANTARHKAERAAADALQAERDAPFRARYLAAKQHEQTAIIVEAYPASAGDKAMRRAIATLWTKEG